MRDGSGLRSFIGCGCMATTALAAVAAAVLMLVWRPPTSSPTPPPWQARWEAERARSLEAIRRERNGRVARNERTVKTGTLQHDRDVALRCDDTLTLEVQAGTFAGPQPVEVKAFAVGDGMLPPALAVVAAYDVKIGPGGPLRAPIVLRVQHPPLTSDTALTAARWDEEKTDWVRLPLERRSPTLTLVQADHLTRMVVTRSLLSDYERYQIDDSPIRIFVRAGFAADVYPLFLRAGEEGLKGGQRQRLLEQRFLEQADARGFTDRSLPPRLRDTEAVRRRYLAAVIHAMVSRVAGAYMGRPPERFDVYVGRFKEPEWSWAWGAVYLPETQGFDSPESLAHNLGHEMHHGRQINAGMNVAWLGYGLWLTEATAEYASVRLAWQDLATKPFDELGVRLDAPTLQQGMGSGITASFIREPLSSPGADKERAYLSAHFLEFLFGRSSNLGPHFLFNQMKAAAATERNEAVLAAYCAKAGLSLDDVYRDFAAWLVLDVTSPAAAAPPRGPAPAPASAFAPVSLGAGTATWSGPLSLPAIYTGEHVSFTLATDLTDSGRRPLALVLGGRGAAQVELYRTGPSRVDLARTPPLRRVVFAGSPIVLVTSLGPAELAHVIVTRGDSGGEHRISLRADLLSLGIRATRVSFLGFRLELSGMQLDGEVDVEWQFGDGERQKTPSRSVDHAWPRAGTYEVRATVLLRTTGEVLGEAAGQVVIQAPPSATARPRPPVTAPAPPVTAPPQQPVRPPETTAPVAPPPPPRPAERSYDEAAALAAYVADFEAQYGPEHVSNYTLEYRLEWVTRPYLSNGQVMGDYRLLRQKRYDHGEVLAWNEEHPAYGSPVTMTTVVRLQEKYPQFWR